MPEWSLEALRLLEAYLDLVARAAREQTADEARSVARIRRNLTASAECDSGDRVHLTQLLRALADLGSPGEAVEMATALGMWRGENRNAQPA